MADVRIVKRAKKGNHKAFQELMDGEKARLYKMAYVYVKNEADALEVFQETVYKAFVSIRSLKNERYFSTWISRILINNAIDLLSKKKKVIPMEKEILEAKLSPYRQEEPETDLLQAVMTLEEKYKTVLILRYYNDYTVKQIAEIIDCPEGTVKTNIHRGINLLREKLREECVNE